MGIGGDVAADGAGDLTLNGTDGQTLGAINQIIRATPTLGGGQRPSGCLETRSVAAYTKPLCRFFGERTGGGLRQGHTPPDIAVDLSE